MKNKRNHQHIADRKHSVHIEQQPLGGAPVLVFAADLQIGGSPFLVTISRIETTVNNDNRIEFGTQTSGIKTDKRCAQKNNQ